MNGLQRWGPMVVTVAVAIGCGSGHPQPAAAKAEPVAAPSTPAASPAAGARGTAAIRIVAKLSGTAPKPQAVQMDADPVCQQHYTGPVMTEAVVSDAQGFLKNVFVYVKDGVSGTFPPPPTPVTLDQAGCWYHPHVFGIQVAQPLEIVNSDATLHNINAKPTLNTPFNIAQPIKGMKTKKSFAKPEVMVKFKCNVHPWMNAFGGVVAHPFFAVSDEHGAATISGLPAGTYLLEAWHEQYGAKTQSVTVGDGQTTSVEWTFE